MKDNLMKSDRPWRFSGRKAAQLGGCIRADISRQNYSVIPERNYYDVEMKCQSCKRAFVFSAKEQKYWYETLGFWIDSVPNTCLVCRKAKRQNTQFVGGLGVLLCDSSNLKSKRNEILKLMESLVICEVPITEKFYQKLVGALKQLKPKNSDQIKKELKKLIT